MKFLTVMVFFATVVMFVGCSKNDKDYMKLAEGNLKTNNIDSALINLEKITKDFPKSESAPTAFFELGRIYQNGLAKNEKREDQIKKSLNNYTVLFENFPTHEKAPTALFMKGYIYSNEMNNFEEATKVYNIFLSKYPNHELTKSVKEELDNMGMTPEQILEKKTKNASAKK